jgi:beta-glucosidase
VEQGIRKKGFFNVMGIFDVLGQYPFLFPVGEKIRPDELDQESKSAIYVIARQAGEGADRRVEKGDFLLDDVERANLELLAGHYAHVIVVINCGGMIDLSFMDEVGGIDALLYFSQAGTEGGNALADIISGTHSPSGKLTDTWATEYAAYPSADPYSYRNGNLDQEDYREGIFVGYRWFDAQKLTVRYPFGFGLSYTTFAAETPEVSVNGAELSVKVNVRNTGSYAGKEILQLYVSKPQSALVKAPRELIAFAKTRELDPQESEHLVLSADLCDLASYAPDTRQWVIENGTYGVWLGNSSRNLVCIACVEAQERIILGTTGQISTNPPAWEDMCPKPDAPDYPADLSLFPLHPTDIPASVKFPEETWDRRVKEWLSGLNEKELVSLIVGGSLVGNCFNNTPGAVGRTTSALVKKGIVNVNFCDGPAGLNVFPEMVITKSGGQKYLGGMPDSYNWGIMKKMGFFLKGKPEDGRPCYQYMTAWPAETMQAQTWNLPLIEQVGSAVGEEMTAIGATLWLAPGMNIHRNPLCGRNFEYYSEDPYLTGKMAAALTRGVQSHKGVGVTIKHFCCNNQEDNRGHVSSNVSERALREIYLRGFRICIQEAKPWAVMTPYNRLNGVYVNNMASLCTQVLRQEWGFRGLVMTDWYATGDNVGEHTKCPAAGNDLIMPGSGKARKELMAGLKNGSVRLEDVRRSAARVLTVISRSNVSLTKEI